MTKVQYESKSNGDHRFWVGRWGRYAVRIDAHKPGVYKWLITLEGRHRRWGHGPGSWRG